MAGHGSSYSFDNHPENSGYSNDDFEKLDAPGNDHNGDHDSSSAAGSAAYGHDFNQDTEVSTTSDNPGEDDEVEDYRYGVGASEADAYMYSTEPVVSFREDFDDIGVLQTEPSASVPGLDSFLDFNNSTAADMFPSLQPSEPFSSSHFPDSIPTSSSLRFDDCKPEDKDVEESEETTEVGRSKSEDGVEATTSSSVKQKQRVDLLEQTAIYQWLIGLGSWLKGVDPRVKDLIYWRDVKKTGIVFGTMLVVLVSLAIFSLLSVVAYLSMAVLTVTFSFVVYKKIMGAVQKSNEGHPFKPLLDVDISLSEDKLKSVIQNILKNANATIREVRRLFLIEDTVDSIKFGILLWALTYIGSWFNGLSLIILATVLLFTLPKVYETYKVQIDNYLELAKTQINNVLAIIQSKVPFLKKKDKAQ